jgi:hypothetical protein
LLSEVSEELANDRIRLAASASSNSGAPVNLRERVDSLSDYFPA